MRKFIRQELIDLYADACDVCGDIVHQSGVDVTLKQSGEAEVLFCHECSQAVIHWLISYFPSLSSRLKLNRKKTKRRHNMPSLS